MSQNKEARFPKQHIYHRGQNYYKKTSLQTFRESETTIKIKFAFFQGGVGRGAGRKIVQNAIFRGKRHDNKILKVNILLSRNFVVMAQAPKNNF